SMACSISHKKIGARIAVVMMYLPCRRLQAIFVEWSGINQDNIAREFRAGHGISLCLYNELLNITHPFIRCGLQTSLAAINYNKRQYGGLKIMSDIFYKVNHVCFIFLIQYGITGIIPTLIPDKTRKLVTLTFVFR